ncbi:hypothetical protein KI688_006677 [Linnemannia hyalina]|uniref:Uncharacterized protein n=1 Tax=Linnemannia hyalina TaxID=64524 RepID=A0A9P8BN82_9FUNG|nr:hypothetical protein KI688_006677 [Linnemannia hyalina]
MIRDEFRSNRYCTSARITAGYLREAEETLKKLRRARDGDQEVRKELKDLVHGRCGRLKEVIDHLSDLINWDPKSTTQRDRYKRLKRAQEQVWDVRTQSSIERDQHPFYKITLHPSLFTFPPELDYYPPHKYPRQLKNKRGLYKNFGGVFLTEVKTSEGSKFPRIRGGTQPEWISMMLKGRVQASVRRVNEWKQLEELQRMMQIEEQFTKLLGVDDTGYVEGIGKRLKEVQEDHARRKRDANERNGLEVGDMDDHQSIKMKYPTILSILSLAILTCVAASRLSNGKYTIRSSQGSYLVDNKATLGGLVEFSRDTTATSSRSAQWTVVQNKTASNPNMFSIQNRKSNLFLSLDHSKDTGRNPYRNGEPVRMQQEYQVWFLDATETVGYYIIESPVMGHQEKAYAIKSPDEDDSDQEKDGRVTLKDVSKLSSTNQGWLFEVVK